MHLPCVLIDVWEDRMFSANLEQVKQFTRIPAELREGCLRAVCVSVSKTMFMILKQIS